VRRASTIVAAWVLVARTGYVGFLVSFQVEPTSAAIVHQLHYTSSCPDWYSLHNLCASMSIEHSAVPDPFNILPLTNRRLLQSASVYRQTFCRTLFFHTRHIYKHDNVLVRILLCSHPEARLEYYHNHHHLISSVFLLRHNFSRQRTYCVDYHKNIDTVLLIFEKTNDR